MVFFLRINFAVKPPFCGTTGTLCFGLHSSCITKMKCLKKKKKPFYNGLRSSLIPYCHQHIIIDLIITLLLVFWFVTKWDVDVICASFCLNFAADIGSTNRKICTNYIMFNTITPDKMSENVLTIIVCLESQVRLSSKQLLRLHNTVNEFCAH